MLTIFRSNNRDFFSDNSIYFRVTHELLLYEFVKSVNINVREIWKVNNSIIDLLSHFFLLFIIFRSNEQLSFRINGFKLFIYVFVFICDIFYYNKI